MAKGTDGPSATMNSYDALIEAERKMSDALGVVPECIRWVLPEPLRDASVADHVRITDEGGRHWMKVSSYAAFRQTCSVVHAKREIPLGSVIWLVLMPQVSLEDAYDLKQLIDSSKKFMDPSNKGKQKVADEASQKSGWCLGVPFLVKNLDHLESKVNEYMVFSRLSNGVKDLSDTLMDKLMTIQNNPGCKDIVKTAQSLLEVEQRRCRKFRDQLILAMYFRGICDDTDLFETFGPHSAILKLRPDLHSSVYVGPGKYDPCFAWKNNSDEEKQATEVALIEAMEHLMFENPSFEKSVSIDQQSCDLVHSEGKYKKLFELVGMLKRLDSSFSRMNEELKSVTLQLDKICIEPTLVGNNAIGPPWMLKEDHDTSDFEDEAYSPWDIYPEH